MSRKRDIAQVRAVCAAIGMTAAQRVRFGDYLHQEKQRGSVGTGIRGDLTYQELMQLAQEWYATHRSGPYE